MRKTISTEKLDGENKYMCEKYVKALLLPFCIRNSFPHRSNGQTSQKLCSHLLSYFCGRGGLAKGQSITTSVDKQMFFANMQWVFNLNLCIYIPCYLKNFFL